MCTATRQITSCLLLLLLSMLITLVQAAETPSPPVPAQAPPETGQPPSQIVLSRDTAVAMAVYRNIDLRIEAFNVKMSELETAKSWGIYNPVFTASGTGGVTAVPGDAFFSAKTTNATIGLTQNLPFGGNISATTQTGYFSADNTDTETKDWRSTAGLAVTLPLLKNAGREIVEVNITMAANTQQESFERFSSTTSEMVANVINAYNRLYVLKQIQETRVTALKSALNLLDEIIKKTKPDAVLGVDAANAEFAVSQRRKDLVEASRSTNDQEAALRYLIGLDMPIRIIPSDPPSRKEPQETDVQAIKSAQMYRNDLKLLQLSLKTAQLQERVARRQVWPELSVNASGGLTGTGFNFGDSYQQIGNNPGTFWSVGMQLNVPLGNTTAGNDYRKNKIRTEQAQEQIRSLSWKIRNEIESDMRALISARLQMLLSEKSNQLAEQRLEEYRKSTALGTTTVQDLLNAENDRNNAINSHLEAAEVFSNAVIKLWKDSGVLLERQGIHIDTSHPGKLAESKVQSPAPVTATTTPETPTTTHETPAETPVTPAQMPEQNPQSSAPPMTAPPVAAVATVIPVPTPLKYTLSIGEYDKESDSSEVIQKINRAGLVPTVMRTTKNETMFRLNANYFLDQKAAQREIRRLRSLKVEGYMVQSAPEKFSVIVGSYRNQKHAVAEQKRLAGLKVKTAIEEVIVPRTVSLITAGSYESREAAVKSAEMLEKQGLKNTIVEN